MTIYSDWKIRELEAELANSKRLNDFLQFAVLSLERQLTKISEMASGHNIVIEELPEQGPPPPSVSYDEEAFRETIEIVLKHLDHMDTVKGYHEYLRSLMEWLTDIREDFIDHSQVSYPYRQLSPRGEPTHRA